MNYFFVTSTFFVQGGIQRGNSPLASGHVAVEQKSSDSAISCPTSNIACSKPRTHLKRRKLVRKKLQLIYRKTTESLLNNLQRDYKEFTDSQQIVITKTNCNLQAIYKESTNNLQESTQSLEYFNVSHRLL